MHSNRKIASSTVRQSKVPPKQKNSEQNSPEKSRLEQKKKRRVSTTPTVYVNGEVVDVEWEEEKNAGDIYIGIEHWLAQEDDLPLPFAQKKIIQQLKINGQEIDFTVASDDAADWREMPIRGIQSVEFFISFVGDLLLDGLEEWDQFVDRIGNRLVDRRQELEKISDKKNSKAQASDEWKNLAEGLQWMQDLAQGLAKLDGSDYRKWQFSKMHVSVVLESLKKEMAVSQKKLTVPVALELLNSWLDRFRIVKSFIKMMSIQSMAKFSPLSDLLQEFRQILDRARSLPDSWKSINLDLQQANDLQAMEKLQKKAGELHEIIDWINILAHKMKREGRVNLLDISLPSVFTESADSLAPNSEYTFAQFIEKFMTEKLEPFVESLDHQDLVTVGDTVEYEFPPIFLRLVEYMERMLSKTEEFQKKQL